MTDDHSPSEPDLPHQGGPEEDLVTAVLTASRVLVAISARSLGEVAESLTLPQFRMLVLLHSRGAMSLSRLAEHLAVNPSTALRMLERLTAAGMVVRDTRPEDRREVRAALTDLGVRTVVEATERRREEIRRIVQAMPARQRTGLVRALRAFADAGAEPTAPDRHPEPLGW
ncbi:MarR family transcriptional regulator [Kitasatospora sp. NA04385]|uniref:MarR family winged helix-turn-helix transcriptional regulator n=1 Tax=Kitasatospora sp. NA04385 TaxID=2742135 RepID=UPI00159279C2|nr:MarR family transcriptional regulator [Kitasatospora sp. NA04385]QKW17692.1 MarR family transcriptional regulator [Kitasatospora sp. NA04385]